MHPQPQLEKPWLARGQAVLLHILLTNLITALAHRPKVTSLWRSQFPSGAATLLDGEFKAGWGQKRSPTSQGCSAMTASTTVVETVSLVWSRRRHRQRREPRVAVFRRGPLSGRGPHFRAGDGPGALSGCSGRVVTTAPPSRAMVPPSQRARDASGSSTRLWHACECCDVSGCLYMICVARSWSDVLIGHRQCYYSTPYTRNRQCMMCELQYLVNRGHLGTFRHRFPRKNDRKRGSFWPRYGHFSGCGMRP